MLVLAWDGMVLGELVRMRRIRDLARVWLEVEVEEWLFSVVLD